MSQRYSQHGIDQLPKSSAEQIQLPALTNGVASMLLALKYQIDESQWWTAEQLRQMQYLQLTELLNSAWQGVPYYQNRLQQAGYHPRRKLTEKIWRRIPILRRLDLQTEGARLANRHYPKSHGRQSSAQSSGSTGTPVRVTTSELSQYVNSAISLRLHDWHRQELSGRLAIIRYIPGPPPASPPDGLRMNFWSASCRPAYHTGPSISLDISTPIDEQAEWLLQVDPHYLLTYPANLRALIDYFQTHALALPALQQVQTISEPLTSDLRALCQEQWGVSVVDSYSTEETGLLALQCPAHNHLHIQSEGVLLEVLNDQGRPCRAGESGRIIVTPLHNFAMPLLRYEIGDYAVPGKACECGRGLPVLEQVLGRVRNMLTLPDGRLLRPRLEIFNYASEIGVVIQQAQVIQHTLQQLELRLVTATPLDRTQESAIIEVLQSNLGHPFEVKVSYLDAIPRSNSGKFEDFISKV